MSLGGNAWQRRVEVGNLLRQTGNRHLGIINAPAPNTIAKYIKTSRRLPSEKVKQSWKAFLDNHRKNIWSMDFLTVPTLCFKVLYLADGFFEADNELKKFLS